MLGLVRPMEAIQIRHGFHMIYLFPSQPLVSQPRPLWFHPLYQWVISLSPGEPHGVELEVSRARGSGASITSAATLVSSRQGEEVRGQQSSARLAALW
jgi:hypothetical protein